MDTRVSFLRLPAVRERQASAATVSGAAEGAACADERYLAGVS